MAAKLGFKLPYKYARLKRVEEITKDMHLYALNIEEKEVDFSKVLGEEVWYVKRLVRNAIKRARLLPLRNISLLTARMDLEFTVDKVVYGGRVRRVSPIHFKGTLEVYKDGFVVFESKPRHPNVNPDNSVCLGNLPRFNNTVDWVVRLVSALKTPNLDSPANAFYCLLTSPRSFQQL